MSRPRASSISPRRRATSPSPPSTASPPFRLPPRNRDSLSDNSRYPSFVAHGIQEPNRRDRPRANAPPPPRALPVVIIVAVLAAALLLAGVFQPDKCPSGQQPRDGRCVACPPGQYRIALHGFKGLVHRLKNPSFARCSSCPNNYHCPSASQYPLPCPVRSYSTQGRPCTQCPINTQPGEHAECKPCPPGHVASATSLCRPCDAGFAPSLALGVCQKCNVNTFLSLDPSSGYGSCLPCGTGTHNPNPKKYPTCVCKIGHEPDERYRSAVGRSNPLTCSPCAVGYYKVQEADSMESCVKCPPNANTTAHPGSFLPSHCHSAAARSDVVLRFRSGIEYALSVIVEMIRGLWDSTLEYFREMLNESWANTTQMFADFDKEGYNVTAPDFTAGQKDNCVLFWFFCRPNFQEPDNPNECPYASVHDMLAHIEAQPQWIEWRSAPLQHRASLARNIAKQFHPDKWDVFNPSCDVDHKGGWAHVISKRVIEEISKDRLAMKNAKL